MFTQPLRSVNWRPPQGALPHFPIASTKFGAGDRSAADSRRTPPASPRQTAVPHHRERARRGTRTANRDLSVPARRWWEFVARESLETAGNSPRRRAAATGRENLPRGRQILRSSGRLRSTRLSQSDRASRHNRQQPALANLRAKTPPDTFLESKSGTAGIGRSETPDTGRKGQRP